MKNIKNITITGIILVAVVSRFIPHPPNFTPILAICMFSGIMFQDKKLSFLIPIIMMVISDAFLGFHNNLFWVYGTLLLIVGMGIYMQDKVKLPTVILGVTSSSIGFFLITNFGVWLGSISYPQTLSGLALCYTAGIPFLKNTILSNFLFSGIFFAVYSIVSRIIPELKFNPQQH